MSNAHHLTSRYVGFFWPTCPDEVFALIDTYVFPAARHDPSAFATDRILKRVAEFDWYQTADLKARQSFHKLVGHSVRVARDYEVETDNGQPRHKKSESGPHKQFTVQKPPRDNDLK